MFFYTLDMPEYIANDFKFTPHMNMCLLCLSCTQLVFLIYKPKTFHIITLLENI